MPDSGLLQACQEACVGSWCTVAGGAAPGVGPGLAHTTDLMPKSVPMAGGSAVVWLSLVGVGSGDVF